MQTLAAYIQVASFAFIVIRWFFSSKGKRFRKKVLRIIKYAIRTFRENRDDDEDDEDAREGVTGGPCFSILSRCRPRLDPITCGYQIGSRFF